MSIFQTLKSKGAGAERASSESDFIEDEDISADDVDYTFTDDEDLSSDLTDADMQALMALLKPNLILIFQPVVPILAE